VQIPQISPETLAVYRGACGYLFLAKTGQKAFKPLLGMGYSRRFEEMAEKRELQVCICLCPVSSV